MKRSKQPVYFYLFLGIVFICIFLFFHFILYVGEDAEKAANLEKLNFNNECPVAYSKVLQGLGNLKLEGSMYSKSRDPISAFLYNNKTELIVYKLPIKTDSPLTKIVKEALVNSSLTDDTNYWVFSSNHFTDKGNPPYLILYKHGIPKIGDRIYFKLLGNNSRTIIKNDSVAIYESNLINFSIAYSNDNSADFYGKRDEKAVDFKSVQIQFKRVNNDVFLLIFLPK